MRAFFWADRAGQWWWGYDDVAPFGPFTLFKDAQSDFLARTT